MTKKVEMNNTRVYVKNEGNMFLATVSTAFPSNYVVENDIKETIDEALQGAFYNFAQSLIDIKIWEKKTLPKSYEENNIVLYDSTRLSYIKYEEMQDGKITCTVKIGDCVATATTTTSYQDATFSAFEKVTNYFINKL